MPDGKQTQSHMNYQPVSCSINLHSPERTTWFTASFGFKWHYQRTGVQAVVPFRPHVLGSGAGGTGCWLGSVADITERICTPAPHSNAALMMLCQCRFSSACWVYYRVLVSSCCESGLAKTWGQGCLTCFALLGSAGRWFLSCFCCCCWGEGGHWMCHSSWRGAV